MLQESVRFYKRYNLFVYCGISILIIGMNISAIALNILWYLAHPKTPGIRAGAYATIAEESPGAPLQPISWRTFRDKERVLPGVPIGAYGIIGSLNATYSHERIVPLRLAVASASMFEKFVEPLAAGHSFSVSNEELASSQSAVILGFHVANEMYGSPEAALGRSISINGVTLEVVGVAAAEFEGLFQTAVDAWAPPQMIVLGLTSRGTFANDAWQSVSAFYAIAGAPMGTSNQFASRIERLLRTQLGVTLGVVPGLNIDPGRRAILRSWAGLVMFVSLLLAVACGFSLGGLLLTHAPRLTEEVRLKRTLGGGTARLCLDLVAGPIWVVGCGFLGANLAAITTIGFLRHQLAPVLPPTALPLQNVLLTLLLQLPLALVVTVGAALLPAVRLLRDVGSPRLNYSGKTRGATRILDAIVIAQIFCSMCACVVAVMVGRSAMRLTEQGLGYQPESRTVLVLGTTKPGGVAYMTDSRGGTKLQVAFQRIVQRLSQLPGVNEVAVSHVAPLDLLSTSMLLSEPASGDSHKHSVQYTGITPSYFSVLGTSLIAGREFESRILAGDPSEAIINQTLSKQLWPGESALGKSLRLEHPFGKIYLVTVVGVASDQRMGGPKESVSPMVFLPLGGNLFQNLPTHILVNGSIEPATLKAAADEELASAYSGLQVAHIYKINERLQALLVDDRRRLFLAISGSSGIALIACIGVYSSLIYFITSKRQELAIRVCCGATPLRIIGIVVSKAARAGIVALAISALCWIPIRLLLSSRWIGAITWSTSGAIIITLLCFSIVILISLFPALRASRLQPAKGLLNNQ
jgi:putative ABC transport system permease protein